MTSITESKDVFVTHNKFVLGEGMQQTMEFIGDIYPCGLEEYCGKFAGCLTCGYYMRDGKGQIKNGGDTR